MRARKKRARRRVECEVADANMERGCQYNWGESPDYVSVWLDEARTSSFKHDSYRTAMGSKSISIIINVCISNKECIIIIHIHTALILMRGSFLI